jgi:hypothetical protein
MALLGKLEFMPGKRQDQPIFACHLIYVKCTPLSFLKYLQILVLYLCLLLYFVIQNMIDMFR